MLKFGIIVTFILTLNVALANAETVTVKYRGPVLLDTFQCATIDRSSSRRKRPISLRTFMRSKNNYRPCEKVSHASEYARDRIWETEAPPANMARSRAGVARVDRRSATSKFSGK